MITKERCRAIIHFPPDLPISFYTIFEIRIREVVMVGFLFQAVMRKQMVRFLYRGMYRHVTPVRIEATDNGAVLCGLEHGSPITRRYNVGEMIGLSVVDDPNTPEAKRHTPWVVGEEIDAKLTLEEKLRKHGFH